MVKRNHPMIHAVPGARDPLLVDHSPTIRLTSSSRGLNTPRDIIITITKTGNVKADTVLLRQRKGKCTRPYICLCTMCRENMSNYEIDICDPKSFDKMVSWIERNI